MTFAQKSSVSFSRTATLVRLETSQKAKIYLSFMDLSFMTIASSTGHNSGPSLPRLFQFFLCKIAEPACWISSLQGKFHCLMEVEVKQGCRDFPPPDT